MAVRKTRVGWGWGLQKARGLCTKKDVIMQRSEVTGGERKGSQ